MPVAELTSASGYRLPETSANMHRPSSFVAVSRKRVQPEHSLREQLQRKQPGIVFLVESALQDSQACQNRNAGCCRELQGYPPLEMVRPQKSAPMYRNGTVVTGQKPEHCAGYFSFRQIV